MTLAAWGIIIAVLIGVSQIPKPAERSFKGWKKFKYLMILTLVIIAGIINFIIESNKKEPTTDVPSFSRIIPINIIKKEKDTVKVFQKNEFPVVKPMVAIVPGSPEFKPINRKSEHTYDIIISIAVLNEGVIRDIKFRVDLISRKYGHFHIDPGTGEKFRVVPGGNKAILPYWGIPVNAIKQDSVFIKAYAWYSYGKSNKAHLITNSFFITDDVMTGIKSTDIDSANIYFDKVARVKSRL